MVEIKGKKYDKIVADVNDAINALWHEADILRTVKIGDDEVQNNVKLFLDAIEIIKAYYYDVYKSNKENLANIEISGFFYGATFWAKGKDIINSLYDKFCMGNLDLIIRKQNNSTGVFSYYDTMSPFFERANYKYELIYKGKTACEVYNAIQYLYTRDKEYDNYIEEASKIICQRESHTLKKR